MWRKHGLVLFNPSIGPLSGATTPDQSGSGSDGNKRVHRILQSSSITGTSPSDCLVPYPGHSLGGGVLPRCRGAVCVFYSLSRLCKNNFKIPKWKLRIQKEIDLGLSFVLRHINLCGHLMLERFRFALSLEWFLLLAFYYIILYFL